MTSQTSAIEIENLTYAYGHAEAVRNLWSVIAVGSNYVAAAVPESQSTGRFGYFVLPDAIIRYSMPQFLSPRSQGGKPVS